MEISVREMLRDVFPANRRKYVKESRRSTMSFCAPDKIVCSVMRLMKLYSRLSLFGKGKGEHEFSKINVIIL